MMIKKSMRRPAVSILGTALMLLGSSWSPRAVQAQTIQLEQIASVTHPTAITSARDGSDRLFVTLQAGRIAILDASRTPLATPFLDITSLVSQAGGEFGLLSAAFHPNYRTNGYFFVDYTDVNQNTVIARYRVSTTDPNVADPTSGTIIMTITQPRWPNHKGGQLQFGCDGYLYIAMGDGGGGGDQDNHAQDITDPLGKLLRIDINGMAPYAIPPDNPFVGVPGARPEIWAYGLRNPWRFSFDRATCDLLIADVGEDLWEEVDYQPASSRGGENYGWHLMEGFHCFWFPVGCNDGTLTLPVLEYGHDVGDCSIIGGYVYRGQRMPAFSGRYIYGDYCTGKIWAGTRDAMGNWTTRQVALTNQALSTFGEDEAGELYTTHHWMDILYRVVQGP